MISNKYLHHHERKTGYFHKRKLKLNQSNWMDQWMDGTCGWNLELEVEQKSESLCIALLSTIVIYFILTLDLTDSLISLCYVQLWNTCCITVIKTTAHGSMPWRTCECLRQVRHQATSTQHKFSKDSAVRS